MKRRSFLVSAGIIAAFTSVPFLRRLSAPRPLVMHDAYSLWYNRPAVAEISGGFCFGYVTTAGDVRVAEIDDQLLVGRIAHLHKYDGTSDHGSPSLLTVPNGKYAGHVIACFSKHSTPLLFSRTTQAGNISSWETSRVIDPGRSTYVSLAALPGGKIVLMHTLQERVGQYSSGEWRKVVARTTEDGGDTWSDPVVIAGIGAGTFPYSTALAVSGDGRCAMTYAIYSATEKRHQGLTVVITEDAFQARVEIPVDLGDESIIDTIPYETKWLTNDVIAISYSLVTSDNKQGVSKLATVDVAIGKVTSNVVVSQVALHTYAGGAAIADGGRGAIYSPSTGGLVHKDLETGHVAKLVEEGAFSSPQVFSLGGKSMLAALKNPLIRTTRDFSSEILIAQLP